MRRDAIKQAEGDGAELEILRYSRTGQYPTGTSIEAATNLWYH
jgi:hypothetical protein